PIDETFISYGYTLDITDSLAFKRDPNAILRGFYILESTPTLKRLGSRFLRALWHARKLVNAQYREDPKNKATFMEIIKMKHGVSHALLDLNQWGILGLFIPAFQHIVGQMQHDLFHAYTVDQHTMRVVRNIRYFTRSEYAHEYPLCTRLMQTLPKNWRLVLAALFHDIGKGRGGNHEEVGAEIVREYCEHFGLSHKETDFVTFLVREHLTMSLVAQKKDISDPEVIKEFAQRVGTEKRLNALYLLTVCDIRATSPKVWNNWKAQLLEELYRQTLPLVQDKEMLETDTDDWMQERQNEAKEKILAAGVSERACQKFWRRLSLVHFLRNSSDAIAWQTIELHNHMNEDGAVVRARPLKKEGGLEVLVYVPDQPLLFARILAFLQKKRFSVMDARIYTTQDEKALNTFIVSDNGDRDPEALIQEVEEGLTDWLNNPQPLPKTRPTRLSRRSRMFPIRPLVRIVADDSGQRYILSVTCTDRIGLLYDIAQVLNRYGINLQTAKIMTMGERVEDVFLIDGPILGDITQTVELEKDLLEVLTPTV
ncbi:MAG: ACT domain-containing protein, partial [Burkholderiaceae bacterium]|nr:ACT domain-containing protein [Burkholderiaceae bacterium]